MRTHRVIGTVIWVVAAVLVVLPFKVAGVAGDVSLGNNVLEVLGTICFLLVGPVYAVTGAVIVSRQPRNSVGWVLIVVAAGMVLSILSDTLIPVEAPESVSAWFALVLGLSSISWVFFVFPVFHLLLTFPNGRPLTPRWRVLVALEAVMVVFILGVGLFGTQLAPLEDSWTVDNPIGFIPESLFGPVFDGVWNWLLIVLTLGGLAAMVLRFRRSRGVERQQVKVFLFAVVFFALVFGVGAIVTGGEDFDLVDLLLPLALIGIGLAVAIGVLRYRLYEIDRVISRTVTYTAVIALLTAAFFGLTALLGSRVSEEPIFVAAATLAAASLFNPLRRQLQAVADRRFNRSRFVAEQVISEFAAGLRDRVDTDDLLEGWRMVVVQTMQPSSLGVWMRP